MEKQTLTERLEASKRVIEAARRESRCLENQVEELERRTQEAEGKLQAFLEKLVGLLEKKCEDVILPTERDVLQTLDNLCNKVKNVGISDKKCLKAALKLNLFSKVQMWLQPNNTFADNYKSHCILVIRITFC